MNKRVTKAYFERVGKLKLAALPKNDEAPRENPADTKQGDKSPTFPYSSFILVIVGVCLSYFLFGERSGLFVYIGLTVAFVLTVFGLKEIQDYFWGNKQNEK